ncbi:MAG TPA: alpha/beta fold hydrolase [Longimicrobiales bacterium]|nr:alpha/beta fold hydrolase [Longimicrobiales bacterium]
MTRLLALGGADCQRAFAKVQGHNLHYLDSGDGPALVLMHGASGGGGNWYRLIPSLARRWRVLAPDLPGFGFSDSIDSTAPLGHQVARLMADWLRTLGVERADVVGTSFGGLVALRLPQYFDVRRVVAIDSVGLTSSLPFLLRVATLPFCARLAVAPSRTGTRLLLRRVLTASRLPEADESALVDYLYASAQRSDHGRLARAFVQFAGRAGQRDVLSAEELARLGRRLLVVWGERDTFLPVAEVERACALAGCSAVRNIPRAGHSPNWEQPQLVLRAVEDFLSDNANS